MKRFLAIILAGLMILSFSSCGGKDENVIKVGALEGSGIDNVLSEEHNAHSSKGNSGVSNRTIQIVNYSNLSSALMDLESGKIDSIGHDVCTAKYIAARNNKIAVVEQPDKIINYSMMTMDSNKEVYDILNNAIKDMKADGTLDSLIENELKAYIENDPEPKDLPHFEGAQTIKIGVTGDLPPMDFVAANGKAAGFNIALLTEIANRAKVNFELVQIDAGARAMALSSGKIDAAFWTKYITCDICNSAGAEKIDGNLITESYFSSTGSIIQLKSEK